MLAIFRSELRKLLSVRSTYIVSALAILLVGFVAFYVVGYKGTGPDAYWLTHMIGNIASTVGVFISIVAILLVGHEYRYNTIMYTLTSANSRTKVMLAKIGIALSYAMTLFAIAVVVGILAYIVGVAFSPNDANAVIKPLVYWADIWRAIYYVLGYGLLGLWLIFILRQLVGAIAAMFIIPTVESLVGILLKNNSKYLPVSALENVQMQALWSAGKSAALFAAYMATAWAIAWYVFLKRDAN
ncbi:MAG TPA: hypothetical protein VF809_00500 [Candidatus Saccharimonadales bacterium]